MRCSTAIICQLILLSIFSSQIIAQTNFDEFSHLSKAFDFQIKKLKLLMSPGDWPVLWNRLYDTFTGNENNKKYWKEVHEKKGALRSGESTVSLSTRNQQNEHLLQNSEESQEAYIKEILAKNEIITDKKLQQQVFSYLQQNASKYMMTNEEINYVEDHQIPYPPQPGLSLQQQNPSTTDFQKQSILSLQQRNLQSTSTNYTVKRLAEPYPSQCGNEGQLITQIQRYYLCSQILANGSLSSPIRVDMTTYNTLISNFSQSYQCQIQFSENKVCACPQGFSDYQCLTQQNQVCYVNITNPPFYKGCQHEDTPYYMYSIHGYDPCYFIEFDKTFDLTFKLICQPVTPTGQFVTQSVNVGYQYVDIVQQDPLPTINSQPQLRLRQASDALMVTIEIRDMKWLSKKATFSTNVSDSSQNGTIQINFPDILESDKNGSSYFVVGGRAYFEANTYSGGTQNSYTFKGFFDQANYVEPVSNKQSKKALIWGLVIGGIVLIVLIIIFYCCWKKRTAQKLEHID